ncbi:MAG: hypothetical protein ACK4TA_03855 [Saprospiraceae bacterium]
METLEIIIGMVFIYLLVSLLASIIQELWASLTSLRGKMLLKAIAKLLEVENQSAVTGESKEKVFADFRKKIENSKIYQKYSDRYLGLKQLPSYLSADQVTALIKELMEKDMQLPATPPTEGERSLTFVPQTTTQPAMLANIQQDELRKQLNIIYQGSPAVPLPGERTIVDGPETKAQEDLVAKAKRAFQQQYDEIMDRATDWYKRGIQWSLITIGLLLAAAFDADTFKIYSNLTRYPDDRAALLQLAQDFVEEDRVVVYTAPLDSTQLDPYAEPTDRPAELRQVVDSLILNEIRNVPSPLGLGWQGMPQGAQGWGIKILGWIVTALAVSLGAPFWFDLLKKLIQVRNAGNRPQTATEKRKEEQEP